MYSYTQHYCLRWNNHRSNLLTVFDELLQNEAFTDVTLVCDGGSPIKCHRMVLAACSPYFQNLFTDLPCKHPVVVLKDVRYADIKAILEYMYRGEVNVGQHQLADLLRVAEALKVKGLVEEKRTAATAASEASSRLDSDQPTSPTGVSTSSTSNVPSTVHSSSNESLPHSTNGLVDFNKGGVYGGVGTGGATAAAAAAAVGSRSTGTAYQHQPLKANAVGGGSQKGNTGGSVIMDSPRMSIPMWSAAGMTAIGGAVGQPTAGHSPTEMNVAGSTTAASMLSSCYQTGGSQSDMSPLKRKKLSSLLMSRDTPILRTVLGQADSSQPVSLVCHPDESPTTNSNVSNSNGVEDVGEKPHIKNEPAEGAQSPYTDISMDYEEKSKLGMSTSFASGISGIATYVPSNMKPEWKRYKQYTRDDIMSAIDSVRNGMSALQAARKYRVPSRTLYDKVKKLGITTSRPFKRGANGRSVVGGLVRATGSIGSAGNLTFPYGISGTSSPFGVDSADEHAGGALINNNSSLLEASSILQHALDARGVVDDKETLAAMVAAAAAHAALRGGSATSTSTTPNINNNNTNSNNNNTSARIMSPIPAALGHHLHHHHHHHHPHHHHQMKYLSMGSLPPSPVVGSDPNNSETNGSGSSDREHDPELHHLDLDEEVEDEEEDDEEEEEEDDDDEDAAAREDDSNQVEDLSVGGSRKQVIMPPMSIASSIMQKEEMLKETLIEEMRREVSVDNAE